MNNAAMNAMNRKCRYIFGHIDFMSFGYFPGVGLPDYMAIIL
jgi:hypothetical protein